MSNEMEPQIKELIARAEDGIEVLKKREKSLKAKASLHCPAISCRTSILTGRVPC